MAGTKVTQHPNRKTSSHNSSPHSTSRDDGMMIMAKHTACSGGNSVNANPDPVDSSRHHRVISIEEDHLPHLLKGEFCPHFHQMNEEEEGAQIDLQMSPMFPSNMSLASLTRGQPVGKEALQKVKDGSCQIHKICKNDSLFINYTSILASTLSFLAVVYTLKSSGYVYLED